MKNIGRNDPCMCGSGRKYKQCCLKRDERLVTAQRSETSSTAHTIQIALKHQQAGRFVQAEALYRQILQIEPHHPDALHFLGIIAHETGRNQIAVELIGKVISLNPDFIAAHNNIGLALHQLGRLEEAIEHYRKAISLRSDYADAHSNLGFTLQAQGKLDQAAKHYQKALALKPDSETHNNLGIVFKYLGNLEAAVEQYLQAISHKSDYAEAYSNLGFAFQAQGKLQDANLCYCKALSIQPNSSVTYNNQLFLHSYHSTLEPQEYLSLARGWELACVPEYERKLAFDKVFQRPPLAGRRLRLGYVSGDYRQHAVSYFIEQLFAQHDRSRIELFAYSNNGMRDAVTMRLQALVDHWRPIMGMKDTDVLDRMVMDQIDVLIDLSGHTENNRMGIFARRAAPVQAHYLGYFASTGLTEMDYFIGDEILSPPALDQQFIEKIWRLPSVWCTYQPLYKAPEITWQAKNSLTIGSFNNLGKLTAQTLELWAKILLTLPNARLILKTKDLADASNRARITNTFEQWGIPAERLELQSNSPWYEYMDTYNSLDIAVDPIGAHGGGTTTCDALWMGVPVICALGDRMTSRYSASMINALGHPEWIAENSEDYLKKIVALARNVPLRQKLRMTQRSSMQNSPLFDAKNLAQTLEDAYFAMFEQLNMEN